ncbi:hypothetical protein [Xenorhabdus mauleonii]|nr:hypothetical protein [Xenorhabdus mauleonii]
MLAGTAYRLNGLSSGMIVLKQINCTLVLSLVYALQSWMGWWNVIVQYQ